MQSAQLVVQDELQAGYYAVDFDAGHLASGVNYYRIDAGAFFQTRKFTLVK